MSRHPLIPIALTSHAFDLAEARRHGLSKDHLRMPGWHRIGHQLYAWHQIADQPMVKLVALHQRMPDAVFSDLTAAWLHGLDCEPVPVHVTLPPTSVMSRRAGCIVHRSLLDGNEVAVRRGLAVTTRVRTVADLGRRRPLVEGVVLLDRAMHRRLVSRRALSEWASAHPNARGVTHLREAITLSDPASESPMETRLRLLLVFAGLPQPRSQISLHDEAGRFVGRPDLYYSDQRLAIEYDGALHRESLAADNRRQNGLVDAGYRLLRFTAKDLFENPEAVVALVRRQLVERKTFFSSV